MRKRRIILALLFVTLACRSNAVSAEEGKTVHHTLTWSIPTSDDGRPTYKFDGKVCSETEISYFRVPETRLDSNSILDIYIPKEADVDSTAFPIPITPTGIFSYWLRARVQIVYHYKGRVLPRRLLVVRLRAGVILSSEAEVSLDGKPLGAGKAAWDKLEKLPWPPRTFLDVFFIHEYPEYPGLPGDWLPGTFKHKLEESNVKLNGFSHEFTDDPPIWPQK